MMAFPSQAGLEQEQSRLKRDDLPESSSGRSNQSLYVFPALYALELVFSCHGLSFGLEALFINRPPG